ncbi:MAG: hypothetical protein Q9164_004507 [Protoblastenia rupestris]
MVELSSSASRPDLTSVCGPGNGFIVAAGKVQEFCPGAKFVGALTAFSGEQRGARHEFDFESAERTFYDVDYEMGVSDSTLGPESGSPRVVQGEEMSSLAGERDVLDKANQGWRTLEEGVKTSLLATGYFQEGEGGELTMLRMDKDAPSSVVGFLQLVVGLNGYVDPGSVIGVVPEKGSEEERMVTKADGFTWSAGERRMRITAY